MPFYRCENPNCRLVYDEALDRCPHCGNRRFLPVSEEELTCRDWILMSNHVADAANRPEDSLAYARRAADTGEAAGIAKLGVRLSCGTGCPADPETGVLLYRQAADMGDANAQTLLGQSLATGTGTAVNYTEAAEWFQRAVAQESPYAMRCLSRLYLSGNGVSRSPEKALELLQRACEVMHWTEPDALVELGNCCERIPELQDLGKAVSCYRKAADLNNPMGMMALGTLYLCGTGVPRSLETAFSLFQKAAFLNEPVAMIALGRMYRMGIGTVPSMPEAVYWEKKAMAAGVVEEICDNSEGVIAENSSAEYNRIAVENYERMAEEGNSEAMFALGSLFQDGNVVTRSWKDAAKWYQEAAVHGHTEAMYRLGCLYQEGKGVSRLWKKAFQWFERAAENGHAEATARLAWFFENGRGTKRNPAKARELYQRALDGGVNTEEILDALERLKSV